MPTPSLDYCQHCGALNPWGNNYRFCSLVCKHENKVDRAASEQRINSFQALAERGDWLPIDNVSLRSLSQYGRRVILLEKQKRQLRGNTIHLYRLTPAGYKLLERWKASMGVSA
jgi:hypothetical protein